jgi:hypothetical protein
MGAYLVFFPFRRLYAFLGFIPIVAPAFAVIGFVILIQTLFMLTTPFSTIAYTAHVGWFRRRPAVFTTLQRDENNILLLRIANI